MTRRTLYNSRLLIQKFYDSAIAPVVYGIR